MEHVNSMCVELHNQYWLNRLVFLQVSMTSVVWLKVHEMRTEQVSPQHLKTSPQGSRTSTPTKNYPPHTPTDRSVLVVDQYINNINIQHLPGFVFRYEYYPVHCKRCVFFNNKLDENHTTAFGDQHGINYIYYLRIWHTCCNHYWNNDHYWNNYFNSGWECISN